MLLLKLGYSVNFANDSRDYALAATVRSAAAHPGRPSELMPIPMPDNTTTIRGQATLEWGDQLRFLVRPYAKALLKYGAIMVAVFAAVWASTLSDQDWLGLRSEPLHSLGLFVADAWPFYVGTFGVLAVVMAGHSCLAFHRYPHINRQLAYEVNAAGLVTRDAAGFVLTMPWTSIIRTRNTPRALHLQTVTRAWRYLLWRAFAPEDRDQILRWATRQTAAPMSDA
jgi:hypothetical protein